MGIEIKSANEIGLMREAGRIVAETLATLAGALRVGMMTRELDDIAREEIEKRGGIPSFKDYRGYPAYVCVSVNEQVVHGIPGERVLRDGDIVSLDLGAIYRGFQGDAAVTVGLGQVSRQGRELIEATRGALENGIAAAKPGAHLGDISAAIQRHAESKGFSVVREYVGHGIGRQMHEDPQVPNYTTSKRGARLEEGLVIAIEPMVNAGDFRVSVKRDKWTIVTLDRKPSAHFEHTVAITKNGPRILTKDD